MIGMMRAEDEERIASESREKRVEVMEMTERQYEHSSSWGLA